MVKFQMAKVHIFYNVLFYQIKQLGFQIGQSNPNIQQYRTTNQMTQIKNQSKKSQANSNIIHSKESQACSDIIQTSQQTTNEHLIKHLNLNIFKLNPCSNPKQHNHKQCMNYHNQKDRKRYGEHYTQNMCAYIQKNEKCPYGEQCQNSHSRVEQFYQSQTYKKKFCSHYPINIGECEYQDYCSFAHSEQEILVDLIHNYQEDQDFYMFTYKTVFCPFNLTEHDKSLCVYAHNWQDYRRNPNVYRYQPIPCYNWKLNQFIVDYMVGCQNGFSCNMCHGWKELSYHPSLYRNQKCFQKNCQKGLCPNYHQEAQLRNIGEEIINNNFRLVGKNKIVSGVFKQQKDCYLTKNILKTQSMAENIQKQPNKTDNGQKKGSIYSPTNTEDEDNTQLQDNYISI